MSRQGISHGLGSCLTSYKEGERGSSTRTPLPCNGPFGRGGDRRAPWGASARSTAVGLGAGICMAASVALEFMQLPVRLLRRDESPGRFSQQEQAFPSNQW